VEAWPCGTIVMMGELFGSESKSQVYGHTHTFLQRNHERTPNLRELLLELSFSSNVVLIHLQAIYAMTMGAISKGMLHILTGVLKHQQLSGWLH